MRINRITDGDEILNRLKNNKKNIIFGAGEIGGLMKDALENFGVEIQAFLVNNGHKNKATHQGKMIYEVSELSLKEDECNIIYAIESDSTDIISPLMKYMKDNVVFANGTKTIFSLLYLYYENYFKVNNIEISKDIINFRGLKIINPFKLDDECVNSFLYEIGDLLLPEFMDDYTKVNEGPYENGLIKLSQGDIVFDCGANIGIFSAIAAHKKCETYAFEPVPNTLKYLEKMSEIYPDSIKICEFALSDTVGDTKFYVSDDNNNLGNTLVNNNVNFANYINVKMTTIDEFVKENNILKVDFIKADIEGAERYMLMGAKETLKRYAPKLSICTYHLKDDPEVLEKIIKEANPQYVIEHRWKKLYAYVP